MAAPTTAPNAEFQDAGKPVANPSYLVDQNGSPVSLTNPLGVTASISSTSTLSSVPASASGVQLLAANSNRKAVYVYNDSTATMYLGFVAHASVTTTNYTLQVPANGFFEMPTSPTYTGEISAVWSSATGNARITELS